MKKISLQGFVIIALSAALIVVIFLPYIESYIRDMFIKADHSEEVPVGLTAIDLKVDYDWDLVTRDVAQELLKHPELEYNDVILTINGKSRKMSITDFEAIVDSNYSCQSN